MKYPEELLEKFRAWGAKGGHAAARRMTTKQLSERGKKAVAKRIWRKVKREAER
jgi:hypothetical protein